MLLYISLMFSTFYLSWTGAELVIKQVTGPFRTSETPHWDYKKQKLYFVDNTGQTVNSYCPRTKQVSTIHFELPVDVIIPIEGFEDKFVIGLDSNISVLTWDSQSSYYSARKIFAVEKDKPKNRFNDGKADAKGRLLIGTAGPVLPDGSVVEGEAALYRLCTNCRLQTVLSPVTLSNGIAWSRANDKLFYVDSPTRRVDLFDYNLKTGQFGNRRTFFDFDRYNITGFPDGMTIDADDNLWVTANSGSRILQVSKTGALVRSLWLPTQRVTSCTFGGPTLSTLFVTTQREFLTPEELALEPFAGAVFAVDGLGVTGTPGKDVSPCLVRPELSTNDYC